MIAQLRHKNLMGDEDKADALAQRRGLSASAAVREMVDPVLLAEELDETLRELGALGGIEDVFGKLPVERDEPARNRARRQTSSISR